MRSPLLHWRDIDGVLIMMPARSVATYDRTSHLLAEYYYDIEL